MTPSFTDQFSQWIVQPHRKLRPLTLLVALCCALGIMRLPIDDDLYAFFPPHHPHLQAVQKHTALFGGRDNIYFTVAPRTGDIFTAEFMAALHTVHTEAAYLPYAVTTVSLAEYPHLRVDGDTLHTSPYIEEAKRLTASEWDALREVILADSTLVHRLVAPDGRAAVVLVRLALPATTEGDVVRQEVVAAAHALRDTLRARYPALEWHVMGEALLEDAFRNAIRRDIYTLMPAMIIVAFGIVCAIIRSRPMVFAALSTIALAGATSLGLAGWFGWPISVVSSSALGLIVTLSVADCIHLITSVTDRLRAGHARTAAVADALRTNMQPIFLTSFSTAVGFLSLHFMGSRPFRDLGNIIAVGVMVAFVLSITWLPTLLLARPAPQTLRHTTGPAALSRHLNKWAHGLLRRRRMWLTGWIVLAIVLLAGFVQLKLDCGYQHIWGTRLPIRHAADFHAERMGVNSVLHHVLDAPEAGGITAPEYLDTLHRFAEWYRTQPDVVHVLSLADHLQQIYALLEDIPPAETPWPVSRETAAQYLLLSEIAFPLGNIDVAQHTSVLTVMTGHLSVPEWLALERSANEWLQANAGTSLNAHMGAGQELMWAHLTHDGAIKTAGGVVATLLLITLLLAITQRSVKCGAASFMVNALPLIMGFGLWGLLGQPIGVSGAAIAGMTVGIVVDDSIHLLTHYGRARRVTGLAHRQAIITALTSVGPALIITSLALAAGLLVLLASPIVMVSTIGGLSTLVILFALLLDITLLPLLLAASCKTSQVDTEVDLMNGRFCKRLAEFKKVAVQPSSR